MVYVGNQGQHYRYIHMVPYILWCCITHSVTFSLFAFNLHTNHSKRVSHIQTSHSNNILERTSRYPGVLLPPFTPDEIKQRTGAMDVDTGEHPKPEQNDHSLLLRKKYILTMPW